MAQFRRFYHIGVYLTYIHAVYITIRAYVFINLPHGGFLPATLVNTETCQFKSINHCRSKLSTLTMRQRYDVQFLSPQIPAIRQRYDVPFMSLPIRALYPSYVNLNIDAKQISGFLAMTTTAHSVGKFAIPSSKLCLLM